MTASTVRIAWRNLWRNRRRTALALLAIGVGQWALLATQGLMRGYGDNIQNAITGPMIGHIQIHRPAYREERALDLAIDDSTELVRIVRALPNVADAAARVLAPVLIAPESDAFIAVVMGVDVASESKPFGLLSGNTDSLPPGHVMVGSRLARKTGATVGQEIAIVGQAADGSLANDLFTVHSIIKGPVDQLNQMGVVMGLGDAQMLLALPEQAHEIVIRVEQLGHVAGILEAVKELEGAQSLEISHWRELVPELVMIIDMVDYAGYFILGLVLVAAVAGIVNTLMMSTYERMHEFGMLLALGCRPGRIVRMILAEAAFLGALGVAVGTSLGYAFIAVTMRTGINMASWGGEEASEIAYGGMRLPLEIIPRVEPFDPMLGLVAVVLVSLLSAAWPALVAGRLDPMEAMRS